MVTKAKNRTESATPKSRINVGKLKLRKETIKDLTPDKQKEVKGGAINTNGCYNTHCSYRQSYCL